MSQTIAIAGAGGLGKHIVDAILEDGKHKLIVLSRGTNQELADRGVEVRTVDYSSVESLTKGVAGVNVIISFIAERSETNSQINLYHAAVAARVKRFIPSEWALDVQKYDDKPSLYEFKRKFRQFLADQNKIEYTLVCNGLFMNYLLPAGTKKYLQDVDINISIEKRTANVPGTGNQPMVLTMAEDIGKAVVWLIDDPKPWPKYTYIKGTVTSWNELIKYGEEVTGEKFDVSYVPLETLQANYEAAAASGNFLKKFFAEIGVMYATDGVLDLPDNEDPSLFEGIRFTQVKELIDITYKK
ncbi:hypothetical protein K450DRAFT_239595 [Umbelopsis ramanniana AG]|uniref:NmrA-like domain-containing protein n=1 Tax=Umbelopsis ramanniana AG TaxID=1314678 RepID=A0AAD5EA14_UMBRA|nr:uncharacterized protein K450DRAFT_239595 [Umbelopsis ramanniana AG]KAI8579893.1 hypothetical protein K450DRAFT_239595 [Umbelopsis ramanniana AG]